MTTTLSKVEEWRMPDAAGADARAASDACDAFAAVARARRPVVLRGAVAGWLTVAHARASPEALCRYLIAQDNGTLVDALMLAPEERGRLFYRPDMRGFNFARNKVTVSSVIEQLARFSRFPTAPSVAIQSALVDACLPQFGVDHRLPLLAATVRPRIWIGNRITTPAHFDASDNLACVVAGSRQFTLFPPPQIANLYLGPHDFAPTPTPISMVDFDAPDFARFPRFRDALASALVADLAPGDALYIPALWWHHVRSVGPLNVLVNYWWKADGLPPDAGRLLLAQGQSQ